MKNALGWKRMGFTWLYTHMLWVAVRFKLESVGSSLDGVPKIGSRQRMVESLGHELAHMICLSPGGMSTKTIAETLASLKPLDADEQECRACAVEILGLRKLKYPRPLKIHVAMSAAQGVQQLSGPETYEKIDKLMRDPEILLKAEEFYHTVRIAQRPAQDIAVIKIRIKDDENTDGQGDPDPNGD